MENIPSDNNSEVDAFGLGGEQETTNRFPNQDDAILTPLHDEPAEDFDDDDDFDDLFDDTPETVPEVTGPYVNVVGGGVQQRVSLTEGQTVGDFVAANNYSRGGGVLYFVNGVSAPADRVLVSGDTLLVQQNMKGGAR